MYLPEVTDSFEYLAGELKDASGKRDFAEYINSPAFEQSYETLPTEAFINSLTDRLARIKMETRTGVLEKVGNSFSDLAVMFGHEYEQRKLGKSFKLWRTPFESLNEEIGGLYSGDVYGIMAESGRGKTYLSAAIIDALLRQGANVLVKSYEVKWYSWMARLLSIATAHEEVLTDERGVKVGVPNKGLLSGALDGDIESYVLEFATKINDYYPGNLILQAKGDGELTRTLDELDRELTEHPEIDVVVIDPFYGLADVYGQNSNKTTGGAAEQAARRLEAIIGAHDVVGIYTIQANTEKQETEDGAVREIKLPKRDQVKTTKAVLEIATNLFVFDAVNGLGKIGIEKGRNGGEGIVIELLALMDYGVLREPDKRTQAGQFASVSGF
ncbi:AAA family ATPase [Paenibacillus sp. FSL H7-0940]|uniref:AAA family ATPase n=1 Tax=Paenibacillus sp. FSL H7-0940 TaxID=2921443 RepID=UPI0030EB43BF